MRKLKGEEIMENAIGGGIFTFGVFFVMLIVFTGFANVSTAVNINQDALASVYEAHRAMACLAGPDGVVYDYEIQQSKLDACVIGYFVQVRDLEDPSKQWLDKIQFPDHAVYVTIRSGDSMYMGEIDVKKK